MLHLTDITHFLNTYLQAHQYPDEPNGMYIPSDRPIFRVGLALEPWRELPEWLQQERIDALFLHRPWQLQLAPLPEHMGVITYHLAFDEHLTIGYNLVLASALPMQHVAVFGEKAGRPLGMTGEITETSFLTFIQQLTDLFGGLEIVWQGRVEGIRKVAVVGAMTPELITQAAQCGADVYVTGQFRKPAAEAVAKTGLSVVAVGHRRSEVWGLQALADVLQKQFPGLETVVA